jgi:uncharacterized protein YoxC
MEQLPSLQIIFELFKAVTPVLIGVVAYMIKNVSTSLRSLEHEINGIKIIIATQVEKHENMTERITKNEQRLNSHSDNIKENTKSIERLKAQIS